MLESHSADTRNDIISCWTAHLLYFYFSLLLHFNIKVNVAAFPFCEYRLLHLHLRLPNGSFFSPYCCKKVSSVRSICSIFIFCFVKKIVVTCAGHDDFMRPDHHHFWLWQNTSVYAENYTGVSFTLFLCKYKPSVPFHLCLHRPLKSWSSTTTRSSSALLPMRAGCSWDRGWTRASPTPTTQPWVRFCPCLSSISLFIAHCLLYLCLLLSEKQPFSLRLIAHSICILRQLSCLSLISVLWDCVCEFTADILHLLTANRENDIY